MVFIIVVLTLERRTNRLLAGPDIVSRGFVYVRESEELMDDARKAVSEALEKCLKGRHTDWNKIKLVIRDAMNDYIWKKTKEKTNGDPNHHGCGCVRYDSR